MKIIDKIDLCVDRLLSRQVNFVMLKVIFKSTLVSAIGRGSNRVGQLLKVNDFTLGLLA